MNISRLRLLPGKVIIAKPEVIPETTTQSGIIIPDTDEGDRRRREVGLLAQIVAIAPDVTRNLDLHADDWVFIPEYAGTPAKVNGEELPYWFIGAGDIIALVGDPTEITA